MLSLIMPVSERIALSGCILAVAVLTKLDRESRRHLEGDEILQLGKVGIVECLNQVKRAPVRCAIVERTRLQYCNEATIQYWNEAIIQYWKKAIIQYWNEAIIQYWNEAIIQ